MRRNILAWENFPAAVFEKWAPAGILTGILKPLGRDGLDNGDLGLHHRWIMGTLAHNLVNIVVWMYWTCMSVTSGRGGGAKIREN